MTAQLAPLARPCAARLLAAAARLLDAIPAQAQARAAYELARDTYEDRRAALVLAATQTEGVRVPADVRDARLAAALVGELVEMRAARDALRSADAEWEAAKVEERAEREALRVALQMVTAAAL